jgi:phage recombination protein Bet
MAVTATRPLPGSFAPKSDFERLMDEKTMIYAPFGAPEKDTIKLTVRIVQDLIAVKTKSGKVCSESDAIKFMMMCKARRLNPFEGDAFLIGYDTNDGPKFSLITAHQAFLKRAEVHAEYDGMTSGVILLDDGSIVEREGDFHLPHEQVVGGWATVYFKGRSHPTTRKIRLERFNTGRAQWAADPAGMIVKCAEADALRSSFPTLVGGLYLDGEIAMDFGDVAKLNTARPIFDSPPMGATTKAEPRKRKEPEPKQPEPEPNPPKFEKEPESEAPQPDAPQEQAPPPPELPKPLKQLRFACKAGGIKEGELIDYWGTTGAIDGSQGTLEEVLLAVPSVVTSTLEHFAEVAAKIRELRPNE